MNISRLLCIFMMFWMLLLLCADNVLSMAKAASRGISSGLVRITEVDVGATVVSNEGKVHITTPDANDQVTSDSSAVKNSVISPVTATYNRNNTWQRSIAVTMILNGNTLNGIRSGSTGLAYGSDYRVWGNMVFISGSYLARQPMGTTKLTFDFSAGADPVLAITIMQTAPSYGRTGHWTSSVGRENRIGAEGWLNVP